LEIATVLDSVLRYQGCIPLGEFLAKLAVMKQTDISQIKTVSKSTFLAKHPLAKKVRNRCNQTKHFAEFFSKA
jgi:hypothetical protein